MNSEFLTGIKDPSSVSFGWWSINEYKQLAFPFVPFVTGCTHYQNHIYLFDVLQSRDSCDLKQNYKITYPSILNIDQTSDSCNLLLHCKSNLTNRDIKYVIISLVPGSLSHKNSFCSTSLNLGFLLKITLTQKCTIVVIIPKIIILLL